MEEVVSEIRAFLDELRTRPDVVVEVENVGPPATEEVLELLEDVPDELRALYAAMNGLHVEWRFVEPSGSGRIRIPPASEWTRFEGDDELYMGFEEHEEALLFDEITPEGATWIVRDQETKAHRLVFAPAGRGDEGVIAAESIPDYLRRAMANGFCEWWPMCFRGEPGGSYAHQEVAIRRFQAPPKVPGAIVPGARVHFDYFAEGGRGEVLRVHTAPASRATEFHGTDIAEVRLDEGSVAWIPTKFMKAWSERDAYEVLRAELPRVESDEAALPALEELARAIGPLASFSATSVGALPSNARLAAGLLSAHPLEAAIDFVLSLHDRAIAARLSFTERAPLRETGAELSPSEWVRFRWEHSVGDTFDGLFGGLLLVLHHRSADEGRPAGELVGAERAERLARCEKASAITEALRSGAILVKPAWNYDDGGAARELGLPEGAVLLSGTGY